MSMPEISGLDLQGGVPLAVARGLFVACLFSLYGALLFRAAVAEPFLASRGAEAASFVGRWRRIAWIAASGAILTLVAWLWLQTASMADAGKVGAIARALPVAALRTTFGRVLLGQAALIVVAILIQGNSRPRLWGASLCAAAAVALQGGHSHAASMYEGISWLLASYEVHVLAAASWLGGLMPLVLLIDAVPDEAARLVTRRFSALALGCVVLLVCSAAYQFLVLIGGLPGLIGTAYGILSLAKLALLAILLGFACMNRFRWAPSLGGPETALARRGLRRSIMLETIPAVLVVLAAATLSNLPPSMHVQPMWPFAQRLSLEAVREDADIRLEVIQAALAVGGAFVLLGASLLGRRLRWIAALAACGIVWFALPHFEPLLVDAYPTSFYHTPTSFSTESIAAGAALFPQHCAVCHGANGRGDGAGAKGLPVPPADLTAGHLWMHSDGELFWWLTHGIEAPSGAPAMPSFAALLSEEQRWNLIDYIRAHNEGVVRQREGAWSPPLRAPAMEAQCGDQTMTLDDFQGRFVRIVFGTAQPAGRLPDVVTISVMPAQAASHGMCVSDDATVAQAYAVLIGIPGPALNGVQVLIDGDGWLRAVQLPGAPQSWDQDASLAAEVKQLRAHKIIGETGHSMMNMKMDMRM